MGQTITSYQITSAELTTYNLKAKVAMYHGKTPFSITDMEKTLERMVPDFAAKNLQMTTIEEVLRS